MTARRFTYPEAADELRVSEPWLRRHIKRLPHSKAGRTVYFTAADLERIDRMHHREPASHAPAAVGPQDLAQLKPLARRRRP